MRLSTALLLVAAALPAQAADYRVNGGVAGNLGGGSSPLDSYDLSSAAAAAGDATGSNDDGATRISGAAWSSAGPGGLRAVAEARAQQYMDAGPTGKQASAQAYASMTYADMLVSGGVPGSFQMTSVNADLDGLFVAQGTLNSFGRATVQVVFLVDDVNVGGGFQVFTANNTGSTTSSSGSLVGWNASGTITSPTFRVTVAQPFELEIQLSVVTEATGPGNEFFHAEALADFGHTLTFAHDGPVFNLAAGLTADSAEAGIVNNVLVPVPEPPVAALALAGLALLGWRSRQR
jgi:MYXO-CTERM domain-containing protein